MTLFQVAEAVGRPVFELEEQLPITELLEWQAFWKLRAAAEKREIEKAKKSKR